MVASSAALLAQLGESWQTGRVPVNGGYLAYHRTGGGGQALVLAHGLTDNGLCWARTAQALQDQFDVVMLDARGHGDSARIAHSESGDPARDIAQAIEALGLTAPIVLGHSVGAGAVAGLAVAYPGLASKIILEDPPWLAVAPTSTDAERRQRFRQQVFDFAAHTDADLAALGRQLSPGWSADEFPAWVLGKRQVDPAALPEWRGSWQETATAITVPTLLIYGEPGCGGLVCLQVADEAMRHNPLIEAVQIPGAGHNVRRENFHEFMNAVRSFLGMGKRETMRDNC